jgi:hypothetical protein
MPLRLDATDDELLAIVEAWIDDLARGDFIGAFGRTKHDAYYGWTPELLESIVAGYGLPEPHPSGTRYVVTSRAAARGRTHTRSVEREGTRLPIVARLYHNLPLNGEWSDLTASFRVERAATGLEVILEEIHVF